MSLNEKIIWQGKPSQVVNSNRFFMTALVGLLYYPLSWLWEPYIENSTRYTDLFQKVSIGFFAFLALFAFFSWLQVRVRSYRVTTERLTERYGIFHAVTEDLELYRIRDITIYEPFSLRMFGLGNLVIYTTDSSSSVVVIQAVPNVEKLQTLIRHQVETMRAAKGIVEFS